MKQYNTSCSISSSTDPRLAACSGKECGSDSCGGFCQGGQNTISCAVPNKYGTCGGTGTQTCVSGQYGTCAVTSADPRPTSCPDGQNCGSVSDGCGGVISCGNCALPDTCTGGGVVNVCGYTPPTCASFTYSAWSPSTCPASGQQTRTVTSSSPTGCIGGSPITSQTCAYTCTPISWTPDPSTVSKCTTLTQTNSCTGATRSVSGTENCGGLNSCVKGKCCVKIPFTDICVF